MRLLGVELTRFRSRRAIVLVLLAATVIMGVMVGTAVWETRPVSAQDRARAVAQAQQEAASPGFQRELKRCERRPEEYIGSEDPAACAEMMPRADWYLSRSTLSLASQLEDRGLGLLMILTALAVVIGATFAGADWATGSISNQLLFEPRRWRVWAAKAAAVTLGVMVACAVIVSVFWLVLYLVVESRGLSTGATVQEQVRWLSARGVLLAGVGALGGYALTMLLRSTVATLAVLFAYAIGGEALTAALPIDRVSQWGLGNNVFAWLRDGTEIYDESIVCPPNGNMCNQTYVLDLAQGATYLGVLLLVTLALSLVLFRRRDVA
ncbi:hypothetical protein [Nocardioides mesophilus]|uniref:ABC transporter permease subunit n=1 Tax=Nocardioides mesophilus TaxID=433659 RepID=A0A7G9RC88_9ACTN|nr:hypothetical protein [Nocardioides mesophilus]QNN53213.1 hypothetical protein H9L09_01605 [Nocardioides mesophilus]